uniref:Terpenoid synthase n=1 Tax=Steinernema glaseri TaxID=37863 RepID=A0A1I7Y4P5_9BILA
MKDIVPTARLQRIDVDISVVNDIYDIIAFLPASIWVDHLLSESCTGFDFSFGPDMVADITSGLIQRWKEMDPRRLPQKIFAGMRMKDVDPREFMEFDVESVDPPLRQKIERIFADVSHRRVVDQYAEIQTRTEYIEHPVYPAFRIYAVFRGHGETKQYFGETEKWTKEDWFTNTRCTLLVE